MKLTENTKALGVMSAPLRAMALVSTSVTAMALFSAPALAQNNTTQPADAASDEPAIVVTGSRIAKPEVESAVPVAVVSAQSISDAGQTNLLDAIRDLPITGQSLDRSASNFQNSGAGVATVNLRNLGASRTLVLINGRRSVGVPGGSAVDLNNIATDLIDHVEIATGGTSAVYGSDAVAGVVNIILKNKFEGLEFHGQNMISTEGDGNRALLSGTGGWSFGDGAGHIVGNFSYVEESAVPSSNRDYSKVDSPTGSAYTPQGAFINQSDGTTFTFDSNNNVIPYTGAASQRYNRAALRLLTTPVKRYIASVLGDYEFSKAANLYAEFTYAKTKVNGMIEPLAVDDSGTQGQSVFNFDGSAFPGISTSNPFMPAAIAANSGPNTFVSFRKRSNGIFDRSGYSDRDYYRGVIGLRGDLGSSWNYDLSYEHSQMRDNTTSGAILMNNYGAALQAITLGSQTVCADPVARAAGCLPINPFGNQTYTPAQLKWLGTYTGQGILVPGATAGQSAAISQFLQKNWQDVVSFSLTGSAFRLPGGPVGIAIGAEYHREKTSDVYDPFTIAGLSSAQSAGNTVGKYNSKEAFVELDLPILSDLPFIHRLSLNGAARYSDYSTVGSAWSYKFGGTFAPTRDMAFRAIYARAVRAPNLSELYSPQSNTAQQVVDPCDQNNGLGETVSTPQRALPAGCAALPGVKNYLLTHPYYTYTLAQVQTIFGLVGGNPNLAAETTNTFTAGATFTPRFLPGFFLTADYYSIKVNNAVATIDPQTAVEQCLATGSTEFCNYVHRNANGFITQVDGVSINAASYHVSGIDVQSRYQFKTHFTGEGEKVTLGVFYTHKFKQEQTPFANGPVSNELGAADIYAGQQLGTGFKDQFTFNLNYSIGPVSLAYRLKYLGPVTASGGTYSISAYTYHDLQVKFDVAKKFEFYVGADNLFNKKPPFIAGGNSQWPGTNTVANTYDLLGTMLYAGVKAKF